MRRKILNLALVAFCAAALTSCSKTMGRYVSNSVNNNTAQTQVVLNQANFKVVKTVTTSVEYEAVVKSKFQDQLRQSAYAQLVKEAHLTGSQALINVTFEQLETATTKGSRATLINATGVVIEFTK